MKTKMKIKIRTKMKMKIRIKKKVKKKLKNDPLKRFPSFLKDKDHWGELPCGV